MKSRDSKGNISTMQKELISMQNRLIGRKSVLSLNKITNSLEKERNEDNKRQQELQDRVMKEGLESYRHEMKGKNSKHEKKSHHENYVQARKSKLFSKRKTKKEKEIILVRQQERT